MVDLQVYVPRDIRMIIISRKVKHLSLLTKFKVVIMNLFCPVKWAGFSKLYRNFSIIFSVSEYV